MARKAAEKAGGAKPKTEKSGKDKIAEKLEAQLKEIEDQFFEKFPAEEEQPVAQPEAAAPEQQA